MSEVGVDTQTESAVAGTHRETSALIQIAMLYSAVSRRLKISSVPHLRRRIMGVNWTKDIDQTLAAAKDQFRPILLDFSAAPA